MLRLQLTFLTLVCSEVGKRLCQEIGEVFHCNMPRAAFQGGIDENSYYDLQTKVDDEIGDNAKTS
jgi:hypothetical protein